jgi:alpha-glucosidase
MPFNFHLMAADWDVPSVRAAVEAVLWNVPEGAWTNWTMGNHDEMRLASRLPEGHERIAATLILTLPGTPFLYYGDELGMRETDLGGDASKDPWGLNVEGLSRDGARTPMQWSPAPNAGFTRPDSEPWLPVSPTYLEVNVDTELADERSHLNMYCRLLALRKRSTALRIGSFQSDEASTDEVFVYRREHEGETLTIAANFSDTEKTVSVAAGSVVFSSNDSNRAGRSKDVIDLAPREVVILDHM